MMACEFTLAGALCGAGDTRFVQLGPSGQLISGLLQKKYLKLKS
jgi:hypothetical protein